MKRCFTFWICLAIAATLAAQNGKYMENETMISKKSPLSVAETAGKLEKILTEKGIPVFAVFDHEKNAKEAGLSLRPDRVIVFGSPKVGTKLMQDYPEISIELPLKIAVWENKLGETWVTFPSMIRIAQRYRIEAGNPVIQGMQTLLENLTEQVVLQTE